MGKQGLWVKLSVAYFDDDRVMEAGTEAELLFVRGLAWGKRDNTGTITKGAMVRLGLGLSDPLEAARTLCALRLWCEVENGYRVTAWDEWQVVSDRVVKQSAAGKRAAHTRWHKTTPVAGCDLCDSDAIRMRPVCDDDAIRMRSAMQEKEKEIYKEKHLPIAGDAASAFAQFWQVWPKRIGKGAAEKAHRRAVAKVGADRVLTGAQAVADRWLTMLPGDRQFVPYPERWLNAGQWDDEVDTPAGVPFDNLTGVRVTVPECNLCDSTGWREVGDRVVEPCECRKVEA
jgi:hypothetical protein